MAYKNSTYIEESRFEYPIIEDNNFSVEPPSSWQLSEPNGLFSNSDTKSDIGVLNPPTTKFFVKAPDREKNGHTYLKDAPNKTLDATIATKTHYIFSVTSTKEAEIAALFDKWNAALQTGNPDEVVKLYAKNGVLLPTLSNQVRVTHSQMKDYFKHFLKYQPKGTILEQNIRVINKFIAINSGIYSFSIIKSNQPETVVARYSFVYHYDGNDWLIVDHHSSGMPE